MSGSNKFSRFVIYVLISIIIIVVFMVLYFRNVFLQKGANSNTTVNHITLQNDFTGAKVRPEDLIQGCFGQDCIPSIDHPKFDGIQSAPWLRYQDVIFTISHKGVERAYPQRILNWHEIVNDTIAGDPIAITFCPLCGSAVSFERKVSGITTEFGVSGKLYDSDLVMYDRYEGNLWQQITGEAIVGPAARRSEKLKPFFLGTTTWGAWKSNHPEGQVLSKNTGYAGDYDQYPYGTYEQDDQLYFGVKNLDKKLPLKTVVYGVEIAGNAKAYPQRMFEKTNIVKDTVGKVPIRLEKTSSGDIRVVNEQTNQVIVPLRLFWFAWAAFHPNTEVYQEK